MKIRTTSIVIVLSLMAAGCTSADSGESTTVAVSSECPVEGEELETAMIYIEHNATDQDTGVHGSLGGEAWTAICIWDPEGQLLLAVHPQGSLDDLGTADLFFESREPPNDEYSLDDLRASFPDGEYRVGAIGHDGVPRVATATFSHDIPAPPSVTAPVLAEDEEGATEAVVATEGLVVTWDPVTETIDGDAVVITGYEVIVTKVNHDDPHGFSRPVFDVHLGPDASQLAVPSEFLEQGTLYELEVLALEVTGNQTISLGFFTTRS
ncbi:MAG: hypothetical protein L0Z63_02900 [Actinobacteria bacterium]|nr:hypothetical protein [Actinomycetota bacterium]